MAQPIAIVSPRYAPDIGGVERHVERLARGLVARGATVEVLTTDPTGRLAPRALRDGVVVRRFPTVGGDATYFVSPWLARWLLERADRYALVHAHGYHTLVPLSAALGARHHRVPLVVTPHYHATGHTPFRALLHRPYRPVAARVLRAARAVIAVSEAERGWLERDFGALPLHVLPNGVELPAPGVEPALPSGRVAGEVTLLAVGRLERYKGVEGIVTALPFLPPEVRLTVIGRGPAQGWILEMGRRNAVSDRVRLLGHVPAGTLAAWYGSADLFVTLSREEAFGMTVLEAAAAGAPVLASDIPAHREVRGYVPPGRIRLVDPAARGPALANAIVAGLGEGRTVGRDGWLLPTWDAMVEGVERVYSEVLGATAG
jgi:glycosyltransferase involved in cell wall biosynthesis